MTPKNINQSLLNLKKNILSPLSLSQLANKFEQLQRCKKEYKYFCLANLILTLILPKLQMETFLRWKPFKIPSMASIILKRWSKIFENKYEKKRIYNNLLIKLILPHYERILNKVWDAKKTHEGINFLNSSRSIMTNDILEYIIHTMIVPRLKIEIDRWDPYIYQPKIATWIFPWNHYIPSKYMREIYLIIFRRISHQFHYWRITDCCPINWIEQSLRSHNIHYKNDISFIFKNIFSKLGKALKNCLKPRLKKMNLFIKVQKWENLLLHERYVDLMQRTFFPNWLFFLRKWLNNPRIKFTSFKTWYLGWKNAFSQSIRLDPMIQENFAIALDMFNWTLNSQGLLPNLRIIISRLNISLPIFLSNPLKNKFQMKNQLEKKMNYSFIDIIQAFAERNSFQFVREFKKNKGNVLERLNEIYSFGNIYCYFDKEIIWAKTNKEYEPINLHELLDLAKKKKEGSKHL